MPKGYEEGHAYLVVTGMRINEDIGNYVKDISVAEDATVKLISANEQVKEKRTMPFTVSRNKSGEVYFTADFKVALDSTYTIEMKFKDGTVIRMDNYILPAKWKTHFYFHSTNGTKSPASVMRRENDEKTKLACCVYALFPYTNYVAKGGAQLLVDK